MRNTDLYKHLLEVSKERSNSDDGDFHVYDICAGNIDDAYYEGVNDGRIELARALLDLFGDEL